MLVPNGTPWDNPTLKVLCISWESSFRSFKMIETERGGFWYQYSSFLHTILNISDQFPARHHHIWRVLSTRSNSLMIWDKRGERLKAQYVSCPIIHTDHVDMLSDEISPPGLGHRLNSPPPPRITPGYPGNLSLKPNFPRTVNLLNRSVPLYPLIRITANLFEIKREMKQIVRLAASSD